jgi:hypothetical protein
MIELLLSCGFDTLEYSWPKASIGICMLADYSVAKKCQQQQGLRQLHLSKGEHKSIESRGGFIGRWARCSE